MSPKGDQINRNWDNICCKSVRIILHLSLNAVLGNKPATIDAKYASVLNQDPNDGSELTTTAELLGVRISCTLDGRVNQQTHPLQEDVFQQLRPFIGVVGHRPLVQDFPQFRKHLRKFCLVRVFTFGKFDPAITM